MIGLMTTLSYHHKLPARSTPEIYERFNAALYRQKGRGKLWFQGRKISAEAMLNGIVLRFLDLSPTDQDMILEVYVPRFEAMLSGAEAPPPAPVDPTGYARVIGEQDLSASTAKRPPKPKGPKKPRKGKPKRKEGQ